MDKKILGIITARGGSKGIPGKNIKPLCGKPLIAYTIEAAKNSKLLSRTIVSTDYEDIANVAKEYGADVPFLRPSELAQDKSTSLDVVKHTLQELEKQGEQYDYVLILQPTSPLRKAEDIDGAIELAIKEDADSVMSMVELSDFAIKKIKRIDGGAIKPFFEEEGRESSQRQDGEKAYKRNCAIYLTKTELVKNGDLFGTKSLSYEMPAERSVDINTPIDFEFAEYLMKKHNENS